MLNEEESNRWNHNYSGSKTAAEINGITTNKIKISDQESETFFVAHTFNKVFSVLTCLKKYFSMPYKMSPNHNQLRKHLP